MLKRLLLTTDAVGGVWFYSIELARGLAARGIEVVLAVLGPPPCTAQRQEAARIQGLSLMVTGLPLDWLADTPDEIEFAARVLADTAREVTANAVQLHAPALVGRVIWPVPVVAMAHSCVATWWRAVKGGVLPADFSWRAEATAIGIARADSVIAPSAAFVEDIRVCYGITRPIEVVLNARTPIGVEAERRHQALTAGRLWDIGKNVAALDAAAGMLSWPVLAAGPVAGPNDAGVSCHHMQILGELNPADLAVEYASASVFVSVARYEPFGLAVLEAAQAGCALVLSDIPTFRELWDGVAVFVPIDSPRQIASAIEDLLRHPEVGVSQGARASDRAASFSVDRMIDATWLVHERMTSRTRTAA